jgi:hypothetical protein
LSLRERKMALEIGGDRFQQLAVRWVEHSVGLVERALRLTALLFVDIAHSLTPLANCQIFSLSHFGLKNFALGSIFNVGLTAAVKLP